MESHRQDLKLRLSQHLEELPALPMALAKLMALDRHREDYFDQVLAIVESEPNLSTRLLSLAAKRGDDGTEPVYTLRSALSRIGTRGASEMALALSVTRVFVPRDDWERALWKHALQVAIAARRLTQFSADNTVLADQAYACGLLHDVGRFVMFLEAPEALKRVDQSEWEGGEGLLAAELEICGLTHAELGALACERWGLPELLVRMVREHHTVGLIVPADHAGKLTAIVRLADRTMFSSALPGSPGLERVTDKEIEKSFLTVRPGFLDIGPKELRGVALATASEANLVANSLGL